MIRVKLFDKFYVIFPLCGSFNTNGIVGQRAKKLWNTLTCNISVNSE